MQEYEVELTLYLKQDQMIHQASIRDLFPLKPSDHLGEIVRYEDEGNTYLFGLQFILRGFPTPLQDQYVQYLTDGGWISWSSTSTLTIGIVE